MSSTRMKEKALTDRAVIKIYNGGNDVGTDHTIKYLSKNRIKGNLMARITELWVK